MTTNQSPARTITYGSAIQARDFSERVNDPNRDRWSVAAMQAVIEALGGRPVAIVADESTGFTLVGVTLTAAYDGGPARGPVVTVVGSDTTTNYRLADIGAVIDLDGASVPGGGVRHSAVQIYREVRSAAIRQAQRDHEADHYGKWDAIPLDLHRVYVTVTSYGTAEAPARVIGHWTYEV
jgi:hypothetical protein